jgi:hypothetical protein
LLHSKRRQIKNYQAGAPIGTADSSGKIMTKSSSTEEANSYTLAHESDKHIVKVPQIWDWEER